MINLLLIKEDIRLVQRQVRLVTDSSIGQESWKICPKEDRTICSIFRK